MVSTSIIIIMIIIIINVFKPHTHKHTYKYMYLYTPYFFAYKMHGLLRSLEGLSFTSTLPSSIPVDFKFK